MGWAGPSQPSPVTGPSQWPGWVKTKGTRDLFTRARTLVKVIKLPSHSVLAAHHFLKWKCKGDGVIPASGDRRCCFWRPKMLLLETEDACSAAWWFSPNAPLVFLLWPLVCAFLLDFSVASKATKKIPACCECSLAESGFFFVCRSGDNFKDNSPHCVLLSCSLFLCVFGFLLCFLCSLFFNSVFLGWFFGSLVFSRSSSPSDPPLPLLCSAFYRARACRKNPFLCSSIHEQDHGQEIMVSWPWIPGFVSCWIGLVRVKRKGWWTVGSKRRHLGWKWQIVVWFLMFWNVSIGFLNQ